MGDDALKDTLSQVQKISVSFHGFSDEEIDAIFPFLTHFPFKDGDVLAQAGETATWVGVLLTGKLDAVNDKGTVLGSVTPGVVVGEMALFRGGTRYCDLVGNGHGALAALLFADIPEMFAKAPHVAYKLINAFGKAAAAKFVLPHPPPPASAGAGGGGGGGGKGGKKGGANVVLGDAVKQKILMGALVKRGLTEEEGAELLKLLSVQEFGPGQQLVQEGKELRHVGLVLHGAVREGEATRGVGELVGAWFALSAFPVHLKILGGPEGGVVGYLTLEAIERLGKRHGALALKALKLIGIGATSTKESDEDVSVQQTTMGTKMAEVLFRNKIKDVEAKAQVQEEERDKALHDKKRNAILMQKVSKAHSELSDKCARQEKEIARLEGVQERLEGTLRKKEKGIESLEHRVAHLQTQLEVQHSEAMQMAAVVKLQGEVEERERQISSLEEELEEEKREADEELAEWKASYRQLQDQSASIYASAQARFRWRLAYLLVVLDAKRRFERKARTRATLLSWLSGENDAAHEESMQSMNLQLALAQEELARTSSESAALRDAASSLADAKATLEARQAELERVAKDAVGREGKLDGFAKTAEERAEAAARRAHALAQENHHLKWAVSQAEERIKESASEAATLVAERDAALGQLGHVRKAAQASAAEVEALQLRLLELDIATTAERADWGARLAEAERAARHGAETVHKLQSLENELSTATQQVAAESVAHEKQRVLLSRLLELEETFGAMLKPPKGSDTPYSLALKELTKYEIRIPSAVRRRPTPASDLASPLLAAPLPGVEARGAAAAATAAAAAATNATFAAPTSVVGTSQSQAAPRLASLPPRNTSRSLPLLRTGMRTPPQGMESRPLPVARGAARAAARRGVSIGEMTELQQTLSAVKQQERRGQRTKGA